MRIKTLLLLFLALGLTACGVDYETTPDYAAMLTQEAIQTMPVQATPIPVPVTIKPTSGPIPSCIGTERYDAAGVTEVIDGDTIRVAVDGKTYTVRYLGIDAPEMDASDPRPGEIALKENTNLVFGKQVWLLRGDTDRDDYGRLLRFVIADGIFVNQRLISIGAATSYNRPHDTYCAAEFDQTMYEAYKNRRGIWVKIDEQYQVSVEPICPDGCKNHAKSCDIKGNISKNGEYIFHLPGSADYKSVSISPSKGERWFCTIDEAIKNGWRPPRAE